MKRTLGFCLLVFSRANQIYLPDCSPNQIFLLFFLIHLLLIVLLLPLFVQMTYWLCIGHVLIKSGLVNYLVVSLVVILYGLCTG